MTIEESALTPPSGRKFVIPAPRPAPPDGRLPEITQDVIDLRGFDAPAGEEFLTGFPTLDDGPRAASPHSTGPATARRDWRPGYLRTLLGADAGAAAIGAALGYQVRFGAQATTAEASAYLTLVVALPVFWLLALTLVRAYEARYLGVGSEEFRRVFAAAVGVTAAVGLFSWAFDLDVARGYVVVALPVVSVVTLVQRYAIRKALHRRRARGREHGQTVVAVGHAGSVTALVRQVHSARYHGMHVVAACTPTGTTDDGLADRDVPVAGAFDDVMRVVREVGADAVAVLPCPELEGPVLRRLAWELEATDAELLVAPSVIEVVGPRISIRPVCGLPLLHVERPELTGIRRVVKGVVDRLVAFVALVLLSPLLLAVAVFVAAGSRGPVLYRQHRVGLGGREFVMLKFRTMVRDASAMQLDLLGHNDAAGPLFKLRHDPRVTSVGRFLRRYSIDELPQIVNVLLGHMSLVGPRPPLSSEVDEYEDAMRRRLLVKPGLTGLWQINGRSDLDWEESMRLDLRYVENWSFAFDFMILWKTAAAVLRGRGAY